MLGKGHYTSLDGDFVEKLDSNYDISQLFACFYSLFNPRADTCLFA